MVYVTTRKPRIYYELRGRQDGSALVMLRGLGRTVGHWGRVAELLEPSFRLVLIDNRGAGRSEGDWRPYSTAHMAADVAGVLDHAGLHRAHVFGMSLGGMVAQRLAIDHAKRVDRLVLGCTTAGGRGAARAKLDALLGLARARFGSVEETVRFEASLLLSASFRNEHPEVLQHWVALEHEYRPRRSAALAQLWAAARHDSAAELFRITAPTLIVSSDEDALISPENSRLLARHIKGAELVWLRGAGHDFATEHSERTAAIVTNFLLDA